MRITTGRPRRLIASGPRRPISMTTGPRPRHFAEGHPRAILTTTMADHPHRAIGGHHRPMTMMMGHPGHVHSSSEAG